jgi:hypothetical protein
MTDRILITSLNKSSTSTSQNGTIIFPNSISGTYKLLSFVMSNVIFNVNAYNKAISVQYNTGGGNTTISFNLIEGWYTSSDLNILLKSLLESNIIGSTFTVTYNSNISKFTIVSTAPYVFKLLFTNIDNNTHLLLGFNNVDQTSFLSTQISDNFADLNPYKIICMSLPSISSILSLLNDISTTFMISTDSNFGSIVNNNYSDDNIFMTFNNKKYIDYLIHDYDGNEIDLHGVDWFMLLQKN